MSRRPLAGKKAFYAMGQRDRALHLGFSPLAKSRIWPDWARASYLCGWHGLRNP